MKIKQIDIGPYNPDWPRLFKEEASLIKNTLGAHCIEIEHVGSTSIPGIKAKCGVDILCIVDELALSMLLQYVGYVFKGELNIPLRNYFSKNSDHSKVNLHVVENDHGLISLLLYFRDYLRSHEDAKFSYSALKEQLLKNPESFPLNKGRFSGYNLMNPAKNGALELL